MNDQQLYHALQQNGTIEQVEAYEILSVYLYRVAYRLLSHSREGSELAKDAMQEALIKVHRSIAQCKEPAAFRGWAAKIAYNTALDLLRRARRTVPLPEREDALPPVPGPEFESELARLLWEILHKAGLSDRSLRVVIGRFFREVSDEKLAEEEMERIKTPLLPSHVQVTRAKNLRKLRENAELMGLLRDLLER